MKHFLVAAMLMVSASCAAFSLQPNKVSESFSWKWNWIQHENEFQLDLVCPVCYGKSFALLDEESGHYYKLVCTGCGWFLYLEKKIGYQPASIPYTDK